MNFTNFDALQTPTPDRQALLSVIREALDAALEQDHQQIKVDLSFAGVRPDGMSETPTPARQLNIPADGADPGQVADLILDSYRKRAPGEGFRGRIRVELYAEDEEGAYALGVYERLVQIGELNYQTQALPGGDGGGYLPPPPPGGPVGFPMHPGGGAPMGGAELDPFGQGVVPGMDEINEEQHGMLMATNAANERRLDMMLRQNQYLVDKFIEQHGLAQQNIAYVMQLASYYMNRYQPPTGPAGGADSPLSAIIGGVISLLMGGGQSGPEAPQSPPEPVVPPAPTHASMEPMEDAFQAPPSDDFDPADITEADAQAWAKANPEAAKRVARGLLPPAMQGLIPK